MANNPNPETARFLAWLQRGGKFAYYWTLPGKDSTWHPAGKPGPIPSGDNIYFGVNPTTQRGSSKDRGKNETIAAVNCVFAEFDAKDYSNDKAATLAHINSLTHPPSVLIDSGGGYHAYWLLKEPAIIGAGVDRQELIDLQAGWVSLVGGDPGAKDLARVLRVPGTENRKYDPARPVNIMWADYDMPYRLAEIDKILKAHQDKQTTPQLTQPAPAYENNGYKTSDDPGEYWLTRALSEAGKGNRNRMGFWLACQLRDSGLPESNAGQVLITYSNQVPNGGGDPYTEREALASVKSAYAHPPRKPAKSNRYQASATDSSPIDSPGDSQEVESLVLLTELGNSRRFSRRFRGELLHDAARGWQVWTGKKWETDETGRVVTLAKRVVDDLFSEAKETEGQAMATVDAAKNLPDDAPVSERETIKKRLERLQEQAARLLSWALKSQTAHQIGAMVSLAESDLAARVADFDADPWLLNCDNGVLDLRTGQLSPHAPTQRITKIAGAAYDPGATCPLWLRFLDRVFDHDQSVIDFIQRAAGYTLTGQIIEQCFFLMYGTGKNGKSVFSETLAALLGDYARKTPTDTLMAKHYDSPIPNDLARLPGARGVLAAELAEGKRLNESLVKDLTGGDRITARFLHKEFFEFTPTFKIWMYGNHKPVISNTDIGIWRRVRLIPFTVTIPDNEQDLKLTEKLRAELPGILAWAVRGCMAWQQDGLKAPATVTKATNDYRAEQDLLAAFLEACCMVGPDHQVIAGDLYKAYKDWSEENGENAKPQKWLSLALLERGLVTKKRQPGTGKTIYKGLGLLAKEESQQETQEELL
jgi:P4 family phage/plasmid primase-like protien